jgi:hypothetical protein
MSPNYALRVRKYLNKLLDAGFIYLIETTQCLSSLVIVEKTNDKLCGLSKIKCLNQEGSIFITFLRFILDLLVGHEMYSFMYDYSNYN